MSSKILIVDDDPQICDILQIALGQADFGVLQARDGATAVTLAAREMPDLIVLDIGLPEMDGLAVCREVRKFSEVPILFLTARGDEIDRVVGLEMGADDYVAKPFSTRELVARVRAILKRTGAQAPASTVARHGIIEVDQTRHICRVNGEPVPLTAREMDLLARLIQRPDHVTSRPQMVDAIYGTNIHVSDRTVDSHLRNLRHKLTQAGCGDAIETVHGVGIRMGQCQGR